MNTPVKFELAKLLKEKGFDKRTSCYYKKDMSFSSQEGYLNGREFNAPTIAEVVMWLYEKHGIWVRITPIPYSDTLTHWRWEHMSTNYSTRSLKWSKKQDYMSPTKAYEAAIEYTLNNLI